jgi:hypothetical protein
MPFSWVRAPSHTSRKIRECMGSNQSKVKFEECVRNIVASDGGSVDQIWFEPNGQFAHIHISWDTPEQKRSIVFDLGAEDIVDLHSAEEIDNLEAEPFSPYSSES